MGFGVLSRRAVRLVAHGEGEVWAIRRLWRPGMGEEEERLGAGRGTQSSGGLKGGPAMAPSLLQERPGTEPLEQVWGSHSRRQAAAAMLSVRHLPLDP